MATNSTGRTCQRASTTFRKEGSVTAAKWEFTLPPPRGTEQSREVQLSVLPDFAVKIKVPRSSLVVRRRPPHHPARISIEAAVGRWCDGGSTTLIIIEHHPHPLPRSPRFPWLFAATRHDWTCRGASFPGSATQTGGQRRAQICRASAQQGVHEDSRTSDGWSGRGAERI